MPTTGPINSKLMRISTGATPTAITCQTDATLTVSNGTRQTTCKDSGQWEEYLYGQTSWSMSGSALFSFDGANNAEDIYDIAAGQTTIAVVYQTGVTGDIKWSGTALVTEWEVSSPGQNENVTVNYTFQGTGALTKTTVS